MPRCDGSHRQEDWSCAVPRATSVASVVVAAAANANIAERLAHRLGGAALHRLEGAVEADRVIVVTDGSDLDRLLSALERVRAGSTRVLALGGDLPLLEAVFPEADVAPVPHADEAPVFWQHVVRALEGGEGVAARPRPSRLPRLFLSHATADEGRLAPTVSALRSVGIDVFLCGDSIPDGTRWWDAILEALREADRFVLALSESTARSAWCAFEAGAAVALGKRIQMLGLDGTPPPSFLAHLQVHDVARARRLRPWLTDDDALFEAICAAEARLDGDRAAV